MFFWISQDWKAWTCSSELKLQQCFQGYCCTKWQSREHWNTRFTLKITHSGLSAGVWCVPGTQLIFMEARELVEKEERHKQNSAECIVRARWEGEALADGLLLLLNPWTTSLLTTLPWFCVSSCNYVAWKLFHQRNTSKLLIEKR